MAWRRWGSAPRIGAPPSLQLRTSLGYWIRDLSAGIQMSWQCARRKRPAGRSPVPARDYHPLSPSCAPGWGCPPARRQMLLPKDASWGCQIETPGRWIRQEVACMHCWATDIRCAAAWNPHVVCNWLTEACSVCRPWIADYVFKDHEPHGKRRKPYFLFLNLHYASAFSSGPRIRSAI